MRSLIVLILLCSSYWVDAQTDWLTRLHDVHADYEVSELKDRRFKHEHIFKEESGKTLMIDVFDYESPLGILGKIADWLFLQRYMEGLLEKRNETIKAFAESDRWREVLS